MSASPSNKAPAPIASPVADPTPSVVLPPDITWEESETVLRNLSREYQAVQKLWGALVNMRDLQYAITAAQATLESVTAQIGTAQAELDEATERKRVAVQTFDGLEQEATEARQRLARELKAIRDDALDMHRQWLAEAAQEKAEIAQALTDTKRDLVAAQAQTQTTVTDATAEAQRTLAALQDELAQIRGVIADTKSSVAAL